ncbi:hypothetical protein JCM8208_000028, partial [Rhodotorula glutinis]
MNLPFTDPSTLVLSPAEVERVWRWEIASGHYPSRRSTPGISFARSSMHLARRSMHLEHSKDPER